VNTTTRLEIHHASDEHVTIWLKRPGRRRLRVIDVTHDEHGYAGMGAVIRATGNLATALGIQVETS